MVCSTVSKINVILKLFYAQYLLLACRFEIMQVLCCHLWFYTQYTTEDVIKLRCLTNLTSTVVLNQIWIQSYSIKNTAEISNSSGHYHLWSQNKWCRIIVSRLGSQCQCRDLSCANWPSLILLARACLSIFSSQGVCHESSQKLV